MRKLFLILFAVGLLVVCWKRLVTASPFSSDKSANESATANVVRNEIAASPGEKLILDLDTGGTVVIHGWDKNMVSVKADLTGQDAGDCEFQMNRISGGVRIQSYHKKNSRGDSNNFQSYSTSFRFDVEVPQKFNVSLHSSGGDVTIKGLDGEMEGTTGGGEILIQNAKGRVNLSTGGGEINIVHSHINGDVSTGGGDIHFDDVTGDINGSTGSGSVIRNKRTTNRSSKTESRREQDGELRIEKSGGAIVIDHAPRGIYAATGGGEIRIGSASYLVSANTGGGDVRIDALDGEVEATTGNGDIHVKMISSSPSDTHDVNLSSGTGDITLIVPPSFSMNLDLKIGYTKRQDVYDIISDFPLNKRTTNQWSDVEGTERKYIYGTGNITGGKNRIRISTVNGNIYIKKG